MIYLLALICFALPTYLIRFKIFGIPTTVLEILIYFAALLQLLGFKREDLKNLFKNSALYTPPIFLLFVAAVISTIISPDKRTSLGILKGWIFDPILLFGLIILNVKTSKDFEKIVYGLASGTIVVSFWGIFQSFGFFYLLPHQRNDPSFLSYLATGRAFGPFESPNYLGMYLAPIAALMVNHWLNLKIKNPNLKNYFLSFCISASLLALFFTKSMGAWLGFLTVFIFLVYFYLSKNKKSVFFTFLALAVLVTVSVVAIFKYRPQRIFDSFFARREVWQVSWHLIKEHPVLGIGLGFFPKIYTQTIPYIHFPPINWFQMHPHNIFLAFWLNLGILGLMGFLWLLVQFSKAIKEGLTKLSRPYATCLIVAMLAILTHGLVDTTYWKNDLSAMFWVIFGLAIAVQKIKKENANF